MKSMKALVVVSLASVAMASSSSIPENQPVFDADLRAEIMTYWSTQGAYNAGLPDEAAKTGSWRVRLTPEGSEWIHTALKSLYVPKESAESLKQEKAEIRKRWQDWIDERIAFDIGQAGIQAASLNSAELGKPQKADQKQSPQPGQMPQDLKQEFGEPPLLYDVFQPFQHVIDFHDGVSFSFNTGVNVRKGYRYFRNLDGVMSPGSRVRNLPREDVDSLFRGAGISESEQRVMEAVSLLEGGFDAINTYDTGYVSIGFIQFACLTEGGHSLGQVLLNMKQNNPDQFVENFERMGLSVTPDGLLAALDPITGIEFTGFDAARKIIADKRFPAIFKRAGQVSQEFRMAQLAVAKNLYYPADDVILVPHEGEEVEVRIGDVFATEAGLATIMERKVQTGKFGDLPLFIADLVAEWGLEHPIDAAEFEYELVQVMKHRKDFLNDAAHLSQPRAAGSRASRAGKRSGRGGG